MERLPLFEAVVFGEYDTVKSLLTGDSSIVRATDQFGFTALHYVTSETDDVEMAQLLVEAGSDVNARNDSGMTPLHIAATAEMATFLLSHGAEINALSNDGATPLHIMASEPDMIDVIQVLLENGADVFIKNRRGQTARDFAELREETEVAGLLK